jgi:type I restriction enzyme M protein
VIRKRTKLKRGEQVGPEVSIRGRYLKECDYVWYAVEYESDPDLRDTEQVPLLEEGGIEAFLEREVLPHAWYEPDSVKIGYEISFRRYFYKLTPIRTLEGIRADILEVGRETEGLLDEIIGGTGA